MILLFLFEWRIKFSLLYAVLFYAGFPNAAVIDAYMNPTVDDSMEAFSWAAPDIESLREYPFTAASVPGFNML